MSLSLNPSNRLSLSNVSTLVLPGAEISAFDPGLDRLWVTSLSGLRIVNFADPSTPSVLSTINFTLPPYNFSNDVNSVAISNGVVAIAVNAPVPTNPGKIFLFQTDGTFLTSVDVGAGPDNVVFTPDGTKILVANEGESNLTSAGAPLSANPEGSISIIDISAGAASPTVQTADFTGFNSQAASLIASGVRLYTNVPAFAAANGGVGTSVAQDLEPEYIAVSPDGTKAFVTLQEANSIAILDIATATITSIVPLGIKDFSTGVFDGSDRDNAAGTGTAINLQSGRPVFGVYQPDAIASYSVGGQTYYITANEGDDRNDFLSGGETTTVSSSGYVLDPITFPNAAVLKGNGPDGLGRLTVSNLPGLRGDTDGDGDIDRIISYGGRSFSILDSNGNRVFDSGSHIDQYVATSSPTNFDDTRSDNKGSEPEGVTTATIGGRVYAFVGLERFAGTIVYDVTDPLSPVFTTFASNPGFTGFGSNSQLQRPEGGLFISAADSPTGKALYVVSNEGTGGNSQGSIVTFQVNAAPVGVNDTNTGAALVEDGNSAASGNVLSNDTDADPGDTLSVSGIRAGTEAAGGVLSAVAGATIVNGTYGQLTINADGSWNYALDNARAATQALRGDQSVVESFTYRVTDSTGLADTAQLSLSIQGTLDSYRLQLLHLSDGEAGLLAPTTAPLLAALADRFEDQFANSITIAGGDTYIPGPFLAGGTDPSLIPVLNANAGTSFAPGATIPIGAVDTAIHNIIGVEASGVGNHEFDLGSNVYAASITPGGGYVGANYVSLTANIDFNPGGVPADAVNARFTQTVNVGGLEEASSLRGRVAPSAVITEGGEKIGFVGVTTQLLESISSPTTAEVRGFPFGPGPNGEVDNIPLLAAQLQPVIDDLRNQGVNKIVLLSHLQLLGNERALAPLLSGVDIILAAGSNTRLGDANDVAVAFPGHAANFADTYPIVTAGADQKTTLIVNTDNEYTYLGRLVVDFDENGDIILPSLAANTAINGAYASTVENVAAAYGVNAADVFASDAFAAGSKGARVKALTDAVNTVIQVKDGNVFGYSDVYLEGDRTAVRTEESNLGNVTADANADALRDALGLGASAPVISLKNGGGIRAQIGSIINNPDGTVTRIGPGSVSQLDAENSLRFDNALMVFDTTAQGIKALLEHSVSQTAPGATPGRFAQVGGLSFSFDPARPVGDRIRDIAIINEDNQITATLYDNGVLQPGVPAVITAVTLNFLANGGDSYPIKANGDNFRYLLSDGTVGPILDEALNFEAVRPANALGEIRALEEYFRERYPTPETAFNQADTPASGDLRIQNTSARADTVLAADYFLNGNGLDNTVVGNDGDNLLRGLAGNDTLNGRGGNDSLDGGAGNDTLNGGTGTDTAIYSGGWVGYDVTNGGATVTDIDTTNGNDGSDTLSSVEFIRFNGVTVAAADAVNDTPIGVNDSNVGDALVEDADSTAAGNVLSNDTDADLALGLGETLSITGARAGTEAAGGALAAISGATVVNGIYGQLTINANGSYSYALDNARAATQALRAGQTATESFTYRVADAHGLSDTAQLDLAIAGAFDPGDPIFGTSANDVINGTPVGETIFGLAGNDTINGNGGDDILNGGTGADSLNGGDGSDTATYADAASGVSASLALGRGFFGEALGDRYIGIENLTGSAFGDFLEGNFGANVIRGGAGNDTIDGRGGDDNLFGEAGDDDFLIESGLRFASIDGGDGFDRILAVSDSARIIWSSVTGIEEVSSDGYLDARIIGTNAADTIDLTGIALRGIVAIDGGAANDNITGSAGSDTLIGGTGNDTIVGGNGNDVITGGLGIDVLTGGVGSDSFAFARGDTSSNAALADTITDFETGIDLIDLSRIDANTLNGTGDDAFSFNGTGAFERGIAGQLRYSIVGTELRVSGDTNGDGRADFTIRVTGIAALADTDFIL